MRLSAFAACSLLLATASAGQGRPAPFGIPMGTPIAKLKKTSIITAKHFLVEPPTANPNFVQYEVTATPTNGVCAIRAYTLEVQSQEDAVYELRRIKKLLSIYGRAQNGAMSKDVSWLKIAPKNVDDYSEKYWDSKLPNSLDLVSAEIDAGPTGGFRIEVFYGYKNLRLCNNWEPGQNRIGL